MKRARYHSRPGVLAGLCLLSLLLCCSGEREINLQGKPAIDFSLRTIDGEDIQLARYRGEKFVHLIFWATWCPSCMMEIPKFKNLYHATQGKPYEILAIDVGYNDSVRKVRQAQEQYQLPYKILFDETGEVSRKYGVMGVPTHIVINKEGIIVNQFNQLPENVAGYLAQFFPT